MIGCAAITSENVGKDSIRSKPDSMIDRFIVQLISLSYMKIKNLQGLPYRYWRYVIIATSY